MNDTSILDRHNISLIGQLLTGIEDTSYIATVHPAIQRGEPITAVIMDSTSRQLSLGGCAVPAYYIVDALPGMGAPKLWFAYGVSSGESTTRGLSASFGTLRSVAAGWWRGGAPLAAVASETIVRTGMELLGLPEAASLSRAWEMAARRCAEQSLAYPDNRSLDAMEAVEFDRVVFADWQARHGEGGTRRDLAGADKRPELSARLQEAAKSFWGKTSRKIVAHIQSGGTRKEWIARAVSAAKETSQDPAKAAESAVAAFDNVLSRLRKRARRPSKT